MKMQQNLMKTKKFNLFTEMSEEINEPINTPPNVLSVNTNKQQDIMESDHAMTNMVKLTIFLLETYLMKQVLSLKNYEQRN